MCFPNSAGYFHDQKFEGTKICNLRNTDINSVLKRQFAHQNGRLKASGFTKLQS